ncbi:MAG: hypothetical protein KBA03_03725 [Anaerolineaceae bacterium]|nr:hypothetical protein [Anaerolineaceae bacterium]
MDWNLILANVLTEVLAYLLPLLVVALVSAIVTWAVKQWGLAKAANPALTEVLEQAALIAVRAAEQAGISGLIENKKEYAISIVEAWLKKQGLPIDIDVIAAAIEAAVWEEFNSEQTVEIVRTDGGEPLSVSVRGNVSMGKGESLAIEDLVS